MAVLSFAETDADTVLLRKAVFRMILSRARSHLAESADIEELDTSQAMEGISFQLLPEAQRDRLADAVFLGTQDLRRDVAEGKPTEEPVRGGIDEKLDEILALLSRHRRPPR